MERGKQMMAPLGLVHLSATSGESALPESTGPTGKRSASKDARSVWKGGKTVKSYLSLPMSDKSPLFVSALELLAHATELYSRGRTRNYKFL
jgi:hypothetical protein